jgi:diketogulonate reductase-like aldo/keto reductase
MAYSPLDQGKLLRHQSLALIAARYHITPAQVVLAWLLQVDNVIAIPKTSRIEGVDEILGARQIKLDARELAQLQEIFPPRTIARMETT